jgi:hypothetical protein
LSQDREGLHGVVTSRAEAQVIRLALTYAILDVSSFITFDHLSAAIAAWDYCDGSARYLFGNADRDPLRSRIRAVLRAGSLTTTEIHRALSGHVQANDLNSKLVELQAEGRIVQTDRATGGRPCKVWALTSNGQP